MANNAKVSGFKNTLSCQDLLNNASQKLRYLDFFSQTWKIKENSEMNIQAMNFPQYLPLKNKNKKIKTTKNKRNKHNNKKPKKNNQTD